MSLLSGFELLSVLVVVGILLLLGIRLRTKSHTTILLLIIALLFVALISLSRLTMALFGGMILLAGIVALFVVISLRNFWKPS
jgi:hypothetical protein